MLDVANTRFEEKNFREALDSVLADQRRMGEIIQSNSALTADETGQLFREARTKDADAALKAGIVHRIDEFLIPAGAPVVSLVLGG